MSGLTCNENFHLGMQQYLHKFMRKEHLYWQTLHCLKPWIYTSVSAAVETSTVMTVTVNSMCFPNHTLQAMQSLWQQEGVAALLFTPFKGCLSQMVKTLDVCTVQNHCISTQIPSRHQWACVWIKEDGPWQGHRVSAFPELPLAWAGNCCPLSLQLENPFSINDFSFATRKSFEFN